jgi:hypothetical protein
MIALDSVPETNPNVTDPSYTVPITGNQPDSYDEAWEDAIRYGCCWMFSKDRGPVDVVLPPRCGGWNIHA